MMDEPPTDKITRARSVPINIRTTPKIGSRLKEMAAQSGKTITQEVEDRLRWSFRADREDVNYLVGAIVTALANANRRTGKDWATDRLTALLAEDLVMLQLRSHLAEPDNFIELQSAYGRLKAMQEDQARDRAELLEQGAIERAEPLALLAFAGIGKGMFGGAGNVASQAHPLDKHFSPMRLTDAAKVALGRRVAGEELPENIALIIDTIKRVADRGPRIEAAEREIDQLWASDNELAEEAHRLAVDLTENRTEDRLDGKAL